MSHFTEYHKEVAKDWIDYNGHMNVMYYTHIFDYAMRELLDVLKLGAEYRALTAKSLFAVEAHITYDREASSGEELITQSRVLSFDAKRLLLFSEMFNKETSQRISSQELLMVHVDQKLRKAVPFDSVYEVRLGDWRDGAIKSGFSTENLKQLRELQNKF